MTAPKVLGLVSHCGECPNCVYYSGGMHQCRIVEEIVRDKTIIAPFCPLADYPSSTIASMQTTVEVLREPIIYGFGVALLSHIATKLKRNLHANALGLTVVYKHLSKEHELYLSLDTIRGIEMRPFEISFVNDDKLYKLAPDATVPLLRERVDDEKDLWLHHRLVL